MSRSAGNRPARDGGISVGRVEAPRWKVPNGVNRAPRRATGAQSASLVAFIRYNTFDTGWSVTRISLSAVWRSFFWVKFCFFFFFVTLKNCLLLWTQPLWIINNYCFFFIVVQFLFLSMFQLDKVYCHLLNPYIWGDKVCFFLSY